MSYIKILKEDSIILFIPKEFALSEVIKFDVIRYSIEVIDDLYENLLSNLNNKVNDTNKPYKSNPIILNYAWSIIESSHIFIKLFGEAIKSYEIKNKDLWNSIRLIRNTRQHLNDRLETLESAKHPFLGYISFYYQDIKTNNLNGHILLGGFSRFNEQMKIEKEKGFEFKNFKALNLNSIEQNGTRHSVDLIELYEELTNVFKFLEDRITKYSNENNFDRFDGKRYRDLDITLKTD